MQDAEEAARLTGLLGLLADPVRARVLYALDLVEELCVGDIGLAAVTEDSVGYALRILRTAGLVSSHKEVASFTTPCPTASLIRFASAVCVPWLSYPGGWRRG